LHNRLLVREDPDVAEEVTNILREDGIDVLLEASTIKAERTTDGRTQLTVNTPGEEGRTFTGSHLLVATGRVRNTERLNGDQDR